MNSPSLRERRRLLGPDKKVKFCQLVRESHSLEEATEWVDVLIRTVQRERRRDEDFDHEIRPALQATPDPLRPPVEWMRAPALFAGPSATQLSPKTAEATPGDATRDAATTPNAAPLRSPMCNCRQKRTKRH